MGDERRLKKATINLYTFTVSKMISTLGANVLAFGISLYILALTGSAMSFATVIICSVLPRALVAPIAGYVADNYPKKKIILIAQAGTIINVLTLLIYTEMVGLSIWAIYLVTIINTICSSFSGVTFSSAIATLVNPERLQKAMSFNQMSISIAAIGGPFIGGMMYGFFDLDVFLLVHIVAYIIAFCLEATMDFTLYSKKSNENNENEKLLVGMKSGITYIKKHRIIGVVMILALWINLFFSALSVGGTFIIIELLKVDATHFGWIEAAGAMGMLLGSLYFASRAEIKIPLQSSKKNLLLLATGMVFIILPLLFESLNYYTIVFFYIVLYFVLSIFEIGINMPLGLFMQKLIDEEYRGRVFGLMETMSLGMMPLGMLFYGVLYDVFPATWIITITSALILLLTTYLLRPAILKVAHPELASET